jgi:hypothetical protein
MALCVGLALGAGSARAGSMQQGIQDFAEGQVLGCFSPTPSCSSAWTSATDSFNRFLGSDPGIAGATNFSAEWTFDLGPIIAEPIIAFRLAIGLYDLDSSAPGSQVASFRLSAGPSAGWDLKAQLESALERPGIGEQMEYNVIELDLEPSRMLSREIAENGGIARFLLQLQGPAWIKTRSGSTVSATGSNGAGLDFVRLSFTSAATAPEPAPLGLGALALVALALWRAARA